MLDGTVTGNAASLQTTGTLDGSNVGYRENNALDLDSKYTVTVPDLERRSRSRVEADTNATFIKAGALQMNAVTAKTTYERRSPAVHDQRQGKDSASSTPPGN